MHDRIAHTEVILVDRRGNPESADLRAEAHREEKAPQRRIESGLKRLLRSGRRGVGLWSSRARRWSAVFFESAYAVVIPPAMMTA